MTRLKHNDIRDIAARLQSHDSYIEQVTGRSVFGLACHAWGVDQVRIRQQMKAFSIQVIPVTAGLGVITDFSETVCDILKFLGFDARVSAYSDTTGLASAFEANADAVMMADDDRFVGINLHTRKVADNSDATGNIFAAALDLMARGIRGQKVLVMGCGPVGEAGAKALIDFGAVPVLYDTDPHAADQLKRRIENEVKGVKIRRITDISNQISLFSYVLEATPSRESIPDNQITRTMKVAAPGVPLGVSETGRGLLGNRLVHDKLELGVAAMAVKMLV